MKPANYYTDNKIVVPRDRNEFPRPEKYGCYSPQIFPSIDTEQFSTHHQLIRHKNSFDADLKCVLRYPRAPRPAYERTTHRISIDFNFPFWIFGILRDVSFDIIERKVKKFVRVRTSVL